MEGVVGSLVGTTVSIATGVGATVVAAGTGVGVGDAGCSQATKVNIIKKTSKTLYIFIGLSYFCENKFLKKGFSDHIESEMASDRLKQDMKCTTNVL